MDAAFPVGTYTAALTGPGGTDTSSMMIAQDFYLGTPSLTGTSFSVLQGLNASSNATITWNSIIPGSATNTLSQGSFSIVDENTQQTVLSVLLSTNILGQAPSTTSVVLPANTLTPGDSYEYSLIFTNEVNLSTSSQIMNSAMYSEQTTGTFTTAAASVPEPSSLVLGFIGLASAGGIVVRNQRRRWNGAICDR
jgi:hypothetical protein